MEAPTSAWLVYLSYTALVIVVTLLVRVFVKKQISGMFISSLSAATIFQIAVTVQIGHVDKFAAIAFIITFGMACGISLAIYCLLDFLFKKK
jgi:hypothetical protein